MTKFTSEPREKKFSRGVEYSLFSAQARGVNEFSIENAAAIHDNAMNWLHQVHGTNEHQFRGDLVNRLSSPNKDEMLILVTSCGAGNDLPYLFSRYPNALFYVQDFAEEMLISAIERNMGILNDGFKAIFFVGDAASLPLEDDLFDLVFHFGGINLFEDVASGVREMYRVTKIGGEVFFGDEGMSPPMYNDVFSEILLKNNPLYRSTPPLEHLPAQVANLRIEYIFHGCFYLVDFIKVAELEINLDVFHQGRRGGSLRTRFYGELEGVNPDLKTRIYEAAESEGVSYVRFLETLLENGLERGAGE